MMATSIRILTSTDVHTILPQLDIHQLINLHTARLFRTLATLDAPHPHRLAVGGGGGGSSGGGDSPTSYTTLVMPSSVANYGTTVKLVSVPAIVDRHHHPPPSPSPSPSSPLPRGLPATTVVVDGRTGAVKAVVNARALSIRTALGSMLATKLLLSSPSSISDTPATPPGSSTSHRDTPRRLVLYGAGRQIRDHALLLLKEYHRSIQHVAILNRSAKAGSELLSYLDAIPRHGNPDDSTSSISCDCDSCPRTSSDDDDDDDDDAHGAGAATPRQQVVHSTNLKFELFTREKNESEWEKHWAAATRAADIICMATPSTSPVLKEEWVTPGQHFILLGSYRSDMAEVPTAVIRRASKVVVDSRSACQIEAGELIAARLKGEDMIDLGELVDDQLKPRAAAIAEALQGDVTIWKSVGLAPQDSMIATLVVEKAEELGVGTVVEDYDRAD